MILGTKSNHENKIFKCRKRKCQVSNINVLNAKKLQFEDDSKELSYTICDQFGIPRIDIQPWYHGHDQFGNLYFQSKDDSKTLSQAVDVFADGTFKPILG